MWLCGFGLTGSQLVDYEMFVQSEIFSIRVGIKISYKVWYVTAVYDTNTSHEIWQGQLSLLCASYLVFIDVWKGQNNCQGIFSSRNCFCINKPNNQQLVRKEKPCKICDITDSGFVFWRYVHKNFGVTPLNRVGTWKTTKSYQ